MKQGITVRTLLGKHCANRGRDVRRVDKRADEYSTMAVEDSSHRTRPGTRTLPWGEKRAVVVHIMSRRKWVVKGEHVADRMAAKRRSR